MGKARTVKLLFVAVAPGPPSLNFATTETPVPGAVKPNLMNNCDADKIEQEVAGTPPTVTLQKPPCAGVIKFAPVMVAT